jgi:NADH-quinone oxidoreductase subunit C
VTTAFAAKEIIARTDVKSAGVTVLDGNTLLVATASLKDLLAYLKNTPGLEFDYLADISAVDYWEYFEILYQLVSIKNNHKLNLKTRATGRQDPVFPSVTGLYKGAELQEREIHDLFGFNFEGHPNLKPIVLWEGFKGYPLRKDYL